MRRTSLSTTTPVPLVSLRGISKRFGHVDALTDINLDLYPGEAVALLGDNGAGKSTLVKVLSGVYRPDDGTITVEGEVHHLENPTVAGDLGIATVFQDLRLVDTRSVAANVYLGREPRRWRFFLDGKRMEADAKAILATMKINLPSARVDVEVLSGGQRQAVAISRALARGGRILLLDEPTAALGVQQTAEVYRVVDDMKASGKCVVLITHDFREVLDRTDRVVVLRQGRVWATARSTETNNAELVGWLTGALPSNVETLESNRD
jgi:D-xylose transport system ATP-binding protein